MPTIMTDPVAVEKSTIVITVSFTDEDGNAVSPATMAWSLVDKDSTVINSRDQVSISNPSSTEDIVLSGDDLAVTESKSRVARWLVLEGTYNSDAGSGLPLKDQCRFYIDNLKKVT